jgi:ubiquinone/menaquinone biosynthesis C-methylase UbiE
MKMQSKQTLFQQAGVTSGKAVLDIGFRNVQELQEIASLVGPSGSVSGIDINPLNVQSASEKLASLSSSSIHVKEGSILAIPFDDCSFDLVLCKGVLHEAKQLEKAVAEMTRVCKRDGFLIIIDLQRFSRLRFELYRFIVRLLRGHCDDVHPGFTRKQLLKLLAHEQLEIFQYQQLPEKGRLRFNEVNLFLLKAKRRVPAQSTCGL